MLQRLLTLEFGRWMQPTRARLAAADSETLLVWASGCDGGSLAEVFGAVFRVVNDAACARRRPHRRRPRHGCAAFLKRSCTGSSSGRTEK